MIIDISKYDPTNYYKDHIQDYIEDITYAKREVFNRYGPFKIGIGTASMLDLMKKK
jgi:hypothetical protein